jgi:hypothetical protein
MKVFGVRLTRHHHIVGACQRAFFIFFIAAICCAPVKAQQAADHCPKPGALQGGAFDGSMQFAVATNKGNMSTSLWISATGTIERDTPDRLVAFLASTEYVPGQIVFNSPGGNLSSGLEIGRIIRDAGMTAHIGTTERIFESPEVSCDNWWDEVKSGVSEVRQQIG